MDHTLLLQLRQVLGFGVRRWKLLLFLVQNPQIDEDDYRGKLIVECSHGHRGPITKAALHPEPQEIQEAA